MIIGVALNKSDPIMKRFAVLVVIRVGVKSNAKWDNCRLFRDAKDKQPPNNVPAEERQRMILRDDFPISKLRAMSDSCRSRTLRYISHI